MAQVKLFYDHVGNTLTVWFDNPQDEYICEETGDEVVLMKNEAGRVIGFEKLNFSVAKSERLSVAFETVAVWRRFGSLKQRPVRRLLDSNCRVLPAIITSTFIQKYRKSSIWAILPAMVELDVRSMSGVSIVAGISGFHRKSHFWYWPVYSFTVYVRFVIAVAQLEAGRDKRKENRKVQESDQRANSGGADSGCSHSTGPASPEHTRTYTVSGLARLFGLSRSTLLYYDRIGLLPPSGRTSSGYRIYRESDCLRLEGICNYRQAGLALEDIRTILASDGKPHASLIERRLKEIGSEILELKSKQGILFGTLKSMAPDGCPPKVDKEMWVAMLRAAGMDDEAMKRWHTEFEQRAPQGHQEFLLSLGIPKREVHRIRYWSRKAIASEGKEEDSIR
jgi:MerR family transcriptional regulator, thiopeptide resistance regulator